MISYAQNAEDVVLARALPWRSGFYVDVGAADAEIASVTKYFYELGWRGINIDPRASAIASLNLHRPRDINLRVAAGPADGTTNLFLFEHDQDLSTTDPTDRDLLASKGHEYEVQEVEVRSLDSILQEHNVEHIDFLKVDVEGGEVEVLAGIDLQRWRPRVVVVEATEPWSHKRRDEAWRPILLRAGYAEGGFDGINAFFAHSDDPEVFDKLAPASVLDAYKPAWLVAIEGELETLRTYIGHLEEELQAQRSHQQTLTEYVRELEGKASNNPPVKRLRLESAIPSNGAAPPNAGQTGAAPVAEVRPKPPPRPSRLAVIGTPESGGSWYGRALALALDGTQIEARHPADVEWNELPPRFVIELPWSRTQLLADTLVREGIAVVSPARHPLDTLLSIAKNVGAYGDEDQDRLGHGFLKWAESVPAHELLRITPSWWNTPWTSRVRYEDLFSSGAELYERILDECSLLPVGDVSSIAREIGRLRDASVLTSDLPGAWRTELHASDAEKLGDIHRGVFEALGYSLDGANQML
jgi:FkbM family methyltransferase